MYEGYLHRPGLCRHGRNPDRSIVSFDTGALLFETFAGAKYEVQMADQLAPLWGASDTNETTYFLLPSTAPLGAYRHRWVSD